MGRQQWPITWCGHARLGYLYYKLRLWRPRVSLLRWLIPPLLSNTDDSGGHCFSPVMLQVINCNSNIICIILFVDLNGNMKCIQKNFLKIPGPCSTCIRPFLWWHLSKILSRPLLTQCYGYIHPLNGPLSGTTRVNRYQKGKTNLDFTGARDSEWQWH